MKHLLILLVALVAVMFSPPARTIVSLIRPRKTMSPSGVSEQRSPVRNQPSRSIEARVASSSP